MIKNENHQPMFDKFESFWDGIIKANSSLLDDV